MQWLWQGQKSVAQGKEHGAEGPGSTFLSVKHHGNYKNGPVINFVTPRHTILGSITDLLQSWIRFQDEHTVSHFRHQLPEITEMTSASEQLD